MEYSCWTGFSLYFIVYHNLIISDCFYFSLTFYQRQHYYFKDKQGDITEDETVRFKSYLLSLGIDDPVTRDAYKTDNQYYRSLALQISDFILPQVQSIGGMIALTDVFCRVNRARSLELLSPEDLLNACKIMESLDLPVKLYQFSSGLMVLQLSSLDTDAVAENTALLVSFSTKY